MKPGAFIGLVFMLVIAAAAVPMPRILADDAIDSMVRQMESKKLAPMHGVASCGGVVRINWQTVPNEGPEGPSMIFDLYNLSTHTIAVKFGYKLTSTLGQEYAVDISRGIGTGHMNAGPGSIRLQSGSDAFPNSIAAGGDHPQILQVDVGPIWVAPNIDVSPPHVPVGAYIDTWRDYRDLIRC